MIHSAERYARQRTTRYGEVPADRQRLALEAPQLELIHNTPARKFERSGKPQLVRNEIETQA